MYSLTTMVGNVATDPELKTIAAGSHLLKFNLAVDREARSAGAKPATDFFPVEVWNAYAISLKSNLKKGDKIILFCRPINRKMTKDGKTVRTCFTASQILFCGRSEPTPHMAPPELPSEESYLYEGQQQTIEEAYDYVHQDQ
jgi:single-stranded DNA-binding protein